jgi:hypothetical protein
LALLKLKAQSCVEDSRSVMSFKRGDHVCAIYSTTEELAREVASFLAEGLRKHERCWYVGDGAESIPFAPPCESSNSM